MATRTIRTERRKRGFFGYVFLTLFWGFNAIMAYGLFSGLAEVGATGASLTSEAERAGHAFGTFIGVGMILTFWAVGAALLGLFVWMTRGPTVIVETTE